MTGINIKLPPAATLRQVNPAVSDLEIEIQKSRLSPMAANQILTSALANISPQALRNVAEELGLKSINFETHGATKETIPAALIAQQLLARDGYGIQETQYAQQ